MEITRTFLVPDYYPDFVCKCGECRSCCCGGWGIAVGMEEYFDLIGRDCSPELRSRLDTAFHLADDRSPEHYAMVTPRFDGRCRIQRDDGLCMLQRECGEMSLPSVCRTYPRAPRISPFPECCTSASCEKTLELLFENTKPVEYLPVELTFKLPGLPESDYPADAYIATRLEAFAILQDRSKPFGERLSTLSKRLYNKEDFCPSGGENADPYALAVEFFEDLSRTSENFYELLPEIKAFQAGKSATKVLSEQIADLDVKLEKLFVNHLFYKSFPNSFKSRENHLAEEAMALCMGTAVTKLAAAAHLCLIPGEISFVDVVAKVFRVIEHSRFDECAVAFLRQKGALSLDFLSKLARF